VLGHLDRCAGEFVHVGLASIEAIARGAYDQSMLDRVVLYTLHVAISGAAGK
jgi:hypothetical protein